MSERELVVLAGASARRSAGAGVHVVAADPTVLTVALDTWETCRFLATHGLQQAGPAGSRGMRDTAVAEVRANAEVDAEARLS
jgi:hypothetical protein